MIKTFRRFGWHYFADDILARSATVAGAVCHYHFTEQCAVYHVTVSFSLVALYYSFAVQASGLAKKVQHRDTSLMIIL
jgi:hypothetical protein